MGRAWKIRLFTWRCRKVLQKEPGFGRWHLRLLCVPLLQQILFETGCLFPVSHFFLSQFSFVWRQISITNLFFRGSPWVCNDMKNALHSFGVTKLSQQSNKHWLKYFSQPHFLRSGTCYASSKHSQSHLCWVYHIILIVLASLAWVSFLSWLYCGRYFFSVPSHAQTLVTH